MSPKARHRSSILAALCFVIGSLAWYWDEWVLVGTTFYLVGSCLFLLNAILNAPEN